MIQKRTASYASFAEWIATLAKPNVELGDPWLFFAALLTLLAILFLEAASALRVLDAPRNDTN